MIIAFQKSNFDIVIFFLIVYHHKPVHSRTQEECNRYGTHKFIRTKHGAHSFRIRISNGNDTLSHR